MCMGSSSEILVVRGWYFCFRMLVCLVLWGLSIISIWYMAVCLVNLFWCAGFLVMRSSGVVVIYSGIFLSLFCFWYSRYRYTKSWCRLNSLKSLVQFLEFGALIFKFFRCCWELLWYGILWSSRGDFNMYELVWEFFACMAVCYIGLTQLGNSPGACMYILIHWSILIACGIGGGAHVLWFKSSAVLLQWGYFYWLEFWWWLFLVWIFLVYFLRWRSCIFILF